MKNLISELSTRKDVDIAPKELVDIVNKHATLKEVQAYLVDHILRPESHVEGYAHQLGFNKYIISTVAGTKIRRIRLHYWKSNEIHNDIHDHIASFASKILAGTLKHDIFTFDSIGGAFNHFQFLALGDCCLPICPPDEGEVKLKHGRSTIIEPGNTYFVHHDELHSAEPVSEFLISLVVQDCPVDRRINVFRQSEKNDSRSSYIARKLTQKEIQISFREMLTLLGDLNEND